MSINIKKGDEIENKNKGESVAVEPLITNFCKKMNKINVLTESTVPEIILNLLGEIGMSLYAGFGCVSWNAVFEQQERIARNFGFSNGERIARKGFFKVFGLLIGETKYLLMSHIFLLDATNRTKSVVLRCEAFNFPSYPGHWFSVLYPSSERIQHYNEQNLDIIYWVWSGSSLFRVASSTGAHTWNVACQSTFDAHDMQMMWLKKDWFPPEKDKDPDIAARIDKCVKGRKKKSYFELCSLSYIFFNIYA